MKMNEFKSNSMNFERINSLCCWCCSFFLYVFSSFSRLYRSNSFRNCCFGFITLGRSPRQFGQNHLPFGFVVSDTHEKWNHSIGHKSLSHNIISPNEIWSHKQYVGSSGSIVSSSGGVSSCSRALDWLVPLKLFELFPPKMIERNRFSD